MSTGEGLGGIVRLEGPGKIDYKQEKERPGLNPTYNGVKTKEEVAELEAKVKILENHLFLSKRMDVGVSKEESYIMVEALNWDKISFRSQGEDGTKRDIITRAYVDVRSRVRIALIIDEHKYDLYSSRSARPYEGGNPFI